MSQHILATLKRQTFNVRQTYNLKFILKREIGHDYRGLQSLPDKERDQPGDAPTLDLEKIGVSVLQNVTFHEDRSFTRL